MSVLVFASGMIGSSLMTLIIGTILGWLCGVKYTRNVMKGNVSSQKSCAVRDNVNITRTIPEYEEVELEIEPATIDLSQNIAYETVGKM